MPQRGGWRRFFPRTSRLRRSEERSRPRAPRPSDPVPGGGAAQAPLRAGRGRAPGSREGRAAAPRLAGQARTRGCAVGAAFSPLQSLQSSCGAGPGLGLDRTVPGTMVSTGPYGTSGPQESSALRSAPASRLRSPGWRPIDAGPPPAAAAPAWQWPPAAPGLRRGADRGGSGGALRGPARSGSFSPPPSPRSPSLLTPGPRPARCRAEPGPQRVAASGSRGRTGGSWGRARCDTGRAGGIWLGSGRLTGRPRPDAGCCSESCRWGRLSRGGAGTAPRDFGWGSWSEMAEGLALWE